MVGLKGCNFLKRSIRCTEIKLERKLEITVERNNIIESIGGRRRGEENGWKNEWSVDSGRMDLPWMAEVLVWRGSWHSGQRLSSAGRLQADSGLPAQSVVSTWSFEHCCCLLL